MPQSKNSSQSKQSRMLEAKNVLPNIPVNRTQAAKGPKNGVFSLVTLTFDPDLQIRPCEGPNTSSL